MADVDRDAVRFSILGRLFCVVVAMLMVAVFGLAWCGVVLRLLFAASVSCPVIVFSSFIKLWYVFDVPSKKSLSCSCGWIETGNHQKSIKIQNEFSIWLDRNRKPSKNIVQMTRFFCQRYIRMA